LLVYLSILLGIAGCSEKPVPLPPSDDKMIEEISDLMQFYDENIMFSGSILVAQDGDTIYEEAFGWANLDWRVPNTVDTKYRIASATKNFTAVLVMQQVEKGRLQLEGKVSDYLPDYPEQNGDRITILQLLTHRSGIIDYQEMVENFMLGDTADIAGFTLQVAGDQLPDFYSIGRLPHSHQDLLGHFADKDLLFTPGSQSEYSNFGYVLLAIILEQVTGQSYHELLQEGILDPAGMKNTGVDDTQEILDKRAYGYVHEPLVGPRNMYLDMSMFLGSGSIYSTVEDLFLFYEALYAGNFLEEASMDQLQDACVLGCPIDFPYQGGPLDAVGLSGAIFSFNSNIRWLTGGHGVQFIALLSNYNNPEGVQIWPVYSETIARQIAAIINGLEYESPMLPAASVIGRAVLESGGDVASTKMTELLEDADNEYRFEAGEFLLIADRLDELDKDEDACRVIKLYVDNFPETPEIRQQLAEYCE